MPLQQEYLQDDEVSCPRFVASSFAKGKGAKEKRKEISTYFVSDVLQLAQR